MTKKLFGAILGIPVVAVGLIASAGTASAASLNAAGEISFTSSVVLTGVVVDGELVGTNFDFVDPLGPPNGEIDIAALSGSGGFASFNDETVGTPDGFLTDNIVFGTTPPTTNPALDFDLVRLFETGNTPGANDTFFTATNFDAAPDFTQIGNDLEVSIGVEGIWTGPGGPFDGSLIFTSQFVGTTEAELITQLQTGEPIFPANGISVTGEAIDEVHSVPEPTTTMAALLAMGLGAVSLKKRKKQSDLT